MLRPLLLATAVSAIACGAFSAQERKPPVDWLSPCRLENVSSGIWCGTYSVFEDRIAQEGRRIDLNVVVAPARSNVPEPDPVFYLQGGPGGGATEAVRGILGLLWHVRRDRDLVFVDQRGTGSSNPLDCDKRIDDFGHQQYFDEFLEVDFIKRCLQELKHRANVSLYTNPVAMDDIDEVRQALGYKEINLYGVSYGTRAALIYLRRHHEHVRSAILKGVVPTNMKNPLPFARAAERSLQSTFDACAEDEGCHAAFPSLESDWGRVLAQFTDGWVSARVVHPETGAPDDVRISKGVFADGIRHLMYTVREASEIPFIVHEAAKGDFSQFAQRQLTHAVGINDALSYGTFLTVTCSEDVRFIEETDIGPQTDGTFLGDYRVRRQIDACRHWKLGDIDASYLNPVQVPTPVLLLSGEVDTATPPEGAAWVAQHMPNAVHVITPNESHSYANLACETRLLAEFFKAGTAETLNTSCVRDTRRPAFLLAP